MGSDKRLAAMVQAIRDHGFDAWVWEGQVWAREQDAECVGVTWQAVRDWLGY